MTPIPSSPQPTDTNPNRNVPEQAGTLENNAQSPVPTERDWITVIEAQEQFRALGLPRSAEAIRKYCRQGKLEAEVIAGPKGDQHMIQRGSIDVFVSEQLKVIEAATRRIPVRDGTTRNIPVHSVTYQDNPEQPGTARDEETEAEIKKLKDEIEKLKLENRHLDLDKQVREGLNSMLEENNNRLLEEVQKVSRDAQEWSRKFGQLEERVKYLQLAAPNPLTPLETETEVEAVTSEPEQVVAQPLQDPAPYDSHRVAFTFAPEGRG